MLFLNGFAFDTRWTMYAKSKMQSNTPMDPNRMASSKGDNNDNNQRLGVGKKKKKEKKRSSSLCHLQGP
jgi:hypothetical protein